MLRTFAAVKVEPNKELIDLFQVSKTLFSANAVKWVEPHNLHLTLRFFGNTSSEAIPTIIDALKLIAQDQTPFDLEISEIGIFGSIVSPRVIYAGVLPCPPFQQLASAIEQLACSIGFEPQPGNLTPHLTLGRPKGHSNELPIRKLIDDFRDVSFGRFFADSVYYYQSVSTGRGPLYRPIEVIPFGKLNSPSPENGY